MWDGSDREQELLNRLNASGKTILFVDGNHENFTLLERYPIELWNGGNTHKIRPNIRHLIRGEVYQLEGKKLLAFGGGNSSDQQYRIPMVSWWPHEMPTTEDYQRAESNLQKVHGLDLIVTHVPPMEVYEMYHINPGPDEPLARYFQSLHMKYPSATWFCGHLHRDQSFENRIFLVYQSVVQMRNSPNDSAVIPNLCDIVSSEVSLKQH